LFSQIRQILSNIAIRFNVFAITLFTPGELPLGAILTRFGAPISIPDSGRAYRGKQPVKNKGAIDMFFWEKTRESAEF
jgi:hypothetical protein